VGSAGPARAWSGVGAWHGDDVVSGRPPSSSTPQHVLPPPAAGIPRAGPAASQAQQPGAQEGVEGGDGDAEEQLVCTTPSVGGRI